MFVEKWGIGFLNFIGVYELDFFVVDDFDVVWCMMYVKIDVFCVVGVILFDKVGC